jgi:hypothetical protein
MEPHPPVPPSHHTHNQWHRRAGREVTSPTMFPATTPTVTHNSDRNDGATGVNPSLIDLRVFGISSDHAPSMLRLLTIVTILPTLTLTGSSQVWDQVERAFQSHTIGSDLTLMEL